MVRHPRFGRRAVLGLTLSTGLGLLAGGSAFAQAKVGATFDEIVAGAKKEGRIVVWSPVPRSQDAQKALVDAFNAKYGTATKMEFVPNPPITSNTRTITEMAGGSVSVDIIAGAAIEDVATIVNAKAVKKYDWSGVFGSALPPVKDLEARVMPEFRGFVLPYQTVAYGIGWNPGAIKDADVPARISDLADPKWSGKFAFNAFLAPLPLVAYVNGADATADLAKRIFANRPIFERGTPAVARAVVTGAVPFGLTISQVAENSERLKEPLKFKLFTDIVPISDVYAYVPENSPNPNTARLFAAWLVSEGSAAGNAFEPMARPGDTHGYLGALIETATKAGAKIAEAKSLADIELSTKLRETLTAALAGQAK